jgi:hypothetical protein
MSTELDRQVAEALGQPVKAGLALRALGERGEG